MPSPLAAAVLLSLSLALCAGPVRGQIPPDDPARAAAEQRLSLARQQLSARQDALQRMVEELQPDYQSLTGGERALDLKNRLTLAMLDALPAAEARYVAAEAEGRRASRATRARILREVLERPVLESRSVGAPLARWIARQVADGLSSRATLEEVQADQILRLIGAGFVPGENWYQFWNRSFHVDLPEAQALGKAQQEYEAAGLALDRLRFPERYGPRGKKAPAGMLVVPGGNYELGPNNGFARPAHKASLSPFAMDRREVTQREYATFVNAQPPEGRKALLPRGWTLDATGQVQLDPAVAEYPVVFVSWVQAAAYATWAGKRLPTEDEWEAAAAGPEGRAWPWGNEFRAGMANGAGVSSGILPVESQPQSRSAAGCFDMAGNVWEWTASFQDGRDVKQLPDGPVNVIIRGGSWRSDRDKLTCHYRWIAPAKATFAHPGFDRPIGFRCAADL